MLIRMYDRTAARAQYHTISMPSVNAVARHMHARRCSDLSLIATIHGPRDADFPKHAKCNRTRVTSNWSGDRHQDEAVYLKISSSWICSRTWTMRPDQHAKAVSRMTCSCCTHLCHNIQGHELHEISLVELARLPDLVLGGVVSVCSRCESSRMRSQSNRARS